MISREQLVAARDEHAANAEQYRIMAERAMGAMFACEAFLNELDQQTVDLEDPVSVNDFVKQFGDGARLESVAVHSDSTDLPVPDLRVPDLRGEDL